MRDIGSRGDVPCGCRAEPAKFCRQAIPADRRTPNPHKQAGRLARYRVKGRCPLRVQGGARRIIADRQSPPTGAPRTPKSKPHGLRPLPTGNPRRQAHPEPLKASRQACAYCRQAIPAARRNRTRISKPHGLRPLPTGVTPASQLTIGQNRHSFLLERRRLFFMRLPGFSGRDARFFTVNLQLFFHKNIVDNPSFLHNPNGRSENEFVEKRDIFVEKQVKFPCFFFAANGYPQKIHGFSERLF